MDYKKAFYSKLEDCYLGVDIKDSEDKSGFTNLLKIKREYFKRIKEYLDNEVDSKKDEASDIYNKLYTFFDSYLNETGTPFFNKTENYKNILARIYSNSKDTNLFYKTQNLYYVKSDTIYKSLEIEYDENSTFKFDTEDFIQNADNTKNKIFFKLYKIYSENNKNIISIKVLNNKTLLVDLKTVFKNASNEFQEDFLAELNSYKIKYDEDKLKKIFFSYKKQMEIDFFIHKDAKTFLEEQFDIWMYNYIYKDSEFQKWNVDTINKLSSIRNISFRIINFISKFEDELKSIWLKPKFAKNTQYVFTINLILSKASNTNELLKSIFEDKSFDNQIKEWKELNLLDENFNIEKIFKSQNLFEEIENKYQYLPIDTKYLSKETKYKLLSSFDNLEEILNGELIKSDNFQALNSIMPKYREKIDLIYIDPPFNLGENASFEYKVNFKDATWASLLDSRMELAREFLSKKGSIFVRCDYNGNYIVRCILNNIFGDENFINEIILSKSAKLTENINRYHSGNDTLLFFSKTNNYIFNVQCIKRNERNWRAMHLPGERWSPIPDKYIHLFSKENIILDNSQYKSKARIILGKELLPPNGRHWALSQDTIINLEKENKIKLINGKPHTQESEDKKLTSNWTDWVGYSSDWGFQTENHENVIKRVILTGSNSKSIILDYHLGSGTTCAVAQKIGRKWIGIEMGEHFYTVIIPRMKKVLSGFQSGISKEINYEGGGAFKYYELESYEEALKNCEYILDENKLIDYGKSRKLIKQLDKTDNAVKLNMSDYRENFDIFTTMSNLMNLKIKKLYLNNDTEICEFDSGEIISINDLDLKKYPKLQSLIFWK